MNWYRNKKSINYYSAITVYLKCKQSDGVLSKFMQYNLLHGVIQNQNIPRKANKEEFETDSRLRTIKVERFV